MTITVLNAMIKPLLEDRLPDWVEPRWFASKEELFALAPQAEIGWFDAFDLAATYEAARLGVNLTWLNTLAAGVDPFPLALLAERGVRLTNGAGLNAIPIAEFAVMAMLTVAKDYRAIVRAQDRHDWLTDAPGKRELYSSTALVIGAGGIGGRIADMLRPFGVAVATVRRTPGPDDLAADEWRARLGEFDWIIIAVPATADTTGMIGAAELAAMRRDAVLLNFARGAVIDQDALAEALKARTITAAFLDVTDPEPLPPEHPLWSLDNCHISMHLSGRAQQTLFTRAAERFLGNLARFGRGEALSHTVDLGQGY